MLTVFKQVLLATQGQLGNQDQLENTGNIIFNLDPITWVILGFLILISIIMVAISIDRGILYKKINKANKNFKVSFSIVNSKEKMKNLTIVGEDSSFCKIFNILNKRLFPANQDEKAPIPPPKLQEIKIISEKIIREELHILEGKLSFLATTTTISPFFGLLGTVWGIMLAFIAMGSKQSTEISAVGPGIAAALITTMVGLIVAIPAVILFNSLNSKLREMVIEMENFSDEIIEKALLWKLIE